MWRWYLRAAVAILFIASMYLGLAVFREVVVEELPLRTAFGTGAAVVTFVFAVGIYIFLLSWAGSSGGTEEAAGSDTSRLRRPPTPESERAARINTELEELRLKVRRPAPREETEK